MRRLAPAVLAAACLLPLSCGDDDGAEPDRADARQAIAAFEDAVTAQGFAPEEDGGEDEDFVFTSDDCRELDALLSNNQDPAGETADEESASFKRSETPPGEEGVAASVHFADAEALQERLDIFADDRTAPCLEEGIANSFADQDSEFELELLDVVSDLQRPTIGDDAVRLELSAMVAAEGTELPLSIELLAVRVGRRAITVMVTGVATVPAVNLEELAHILLTGAPA